jgi:hypothetical protein
LRFVSWSELTLGLLAVLLAVRLLALRGQLQATTTKLASLQIAYTDLQADGRRMQQDVRTLRQLARGSVIADDAVLSGHTPSGQEVSLMLAHIGTPLLLFTVDRNCALCTAWRIPLTEFARTRPCGLTVLGIALNDQLDHRWTQDSVEIDILVGAQGTGWRTLSLDEPAVAVLLGDRGRFLGRWAGTPDTRRIAEIRSTVMHTCTTE